MLLTCRCMAVSPLRTAAVVVCVASINGPEDEEASEAREASGAAAVCCCKMELKKETTSALKFHPMQQISDTSTFCRVEFLKNKKLKICVLGLLAKQMSKSTVNPFRALPNSRSYPFHSYTL